MEDDIQKVRSIRGSVEKNTALLRQDFQLTKDYLLLCVRKEDWHDVMDASADIREIVAKLSVPA